MNQLNAKINWLFYYYAQRRWQHLPLWTARRLPEPVRRWAVIDAGARVSTSDKFAKTAVPDLLFMDVLENM